MNVGFTGSRKGMSLDQRVQLEVVLQALALVEADREFHYGVHDSVDLVADEQARQVAMRYGFVPMPHMARRGTELKRDRELVAAVAILIAGPETDTEQLRSGTWATVRYAREALKPVVMLSRGRR